MNKKPQDSTAEFERAIADLGEKHYVLRLYVTGTTIRSTRAIANVRKICEQHLKGRYQLEVIDLYQQPDLAKPEQIIAAPTLIKELPLPVRRVLGDMSHTEQVLIVLGVPRRSAEDTAGTSKP